MKNRHLFSTSVFRSGKNSVQFEWNSIQEISSNVVPWKSTQETSYLCCRRK